MDGAEASLLYGTVHSDITSKSKLGRVGGRDGISGILGKVSEVCRRAAVTRSGTPISADLGGSSKYSSEKLED
jgi:hypothetical protein